MRHYSLRKCRHHLKTFVKRFRRRKKHLSSSVQNELKNHLIAFQDKISGKDREGANKELETLFILDKSYLSPSSFGKFIRYVWGLILALFVAILVRQMWFELYEIPTGSMRPTLEEKDRLVVNKTTFGINIPLTTKHLLFDPELVKRSGIFIFTGKDMDIYDVNTMYFWIFPGKKQYIKRLMGKPGDTLYFYGGLLYGIDKEGKDISPELQLKELERIDHVPFLDFSGKAITLSKPTSGVFTPVVFYQMNEPVARLNLGSRNRISGEILPSAGIKGDEYGDLWGFKNFAMARMLTREEFLDFGGDKSLPEVDYYLELAHDPNLKNAQLEKDKYGRLRPGLGLFNSYIPLSQKDLKTIQENLYTSRFVVKNGYAVHYGVSLKSDRPPPFTPKLAGVPDGTYEFYYGTPYEIKWQGIRWELPDDHPLRNLTPAQLRELFNLGMEFDTRFSPTSALQPLRPSRFAYFREGDLYLMGAPFLDKTDETLITFLNQENEKASATTSGKLYYPFIDHGAPLNKDGSLDIEFIKKYGLKIPPKSYLALGDNYARSADSRDFGFVPEGNIRGSPSYIFWPPGKRFGAPNQPGYAFFTLPTMIIWGVVLLIFLLWYGHRRKHYTIPMKID